MSWAAWERLEKQGDIMYVEGATVGQVGFRAKAFVRDKFGPLAVVVSTAVPDMGAVAVALVYVPLPREDVRGPDLGRWRRERRARDQVEADKRSLKERNFRVASAGHVEFVEECLRLEGFKK